LVVDNGGTLANVQLPDHGLRMRVLYEATPGSYAARNRGVEESQGRFLAFTDGDCVPDPDWLARGIEKLEANSQIFVGGHVAMSYLIPDSPRVAELYDTLFASFDQKENVQEKGFSVTANLFVTRQELDRVGLFNGQMKSRGDLEWCERAVAAGLTPTYASDAVVGHPARNEFSELLGKARRLTGGHHDLARKKPLALLRHLKWLIVFATLQPLRELRVSAKSGQRAPWPKKVGVGAYIVLLNMARLVERVRLIFGGDSRR